MEKSEFRLVSSAQLGGLRVEKGDILRESITMKTVKVLNVLRNESGETHLLVEYNAPGNFGMPFQKSINSFASPVMLPSSVLMTVWGVVGWAGRGACDGRDAKGVSRFGLVMLLYPREGHWLPPPRGFYDLVSRIRAGHGEWRWARHGYAAVQRVGIEYG